MAFVGDEPRADDPLLAFAPYLHARPRRNSITPDKQRAFVSHLAATGIVSDAARHIGRSMEALYKLRARPGAEGFAAAWDAAVERGVDRLEHGALARAIQGTPVWKVTPDGDMMTYGTKHNEALVMFFLRHRRPERYAAEVKPGHPLYERIRHEVLGELMREGEGREAEVLALLSEKLDALAAARSTGTRPAPDGSPAPADPDRE
ncbi:hypothetical protein [Pseudoblastomonas halimionae]|uniref:hypothetical protein n=1 Tax=Alteriqipengyuania halimionae TaxID=1926630 RepID=UPI0018F8C2DE|nr:hypothetical protein [Alteriqipengyuania halimionae]